MSSPSLIPPALLQACAGRPRLLAFLDTVEAAIDPAHGLPVKARLDIARLGRNGILPRTWLMERGGDGQFRYRLTGEEVARNFERSPRGRTLDEAIGPGAAARYGPTFAAALADRKIILVEGAVRRGGSKVYDGCRLFVPLCEAGAEPRLLLCCFDYDNADLFILRRPGLSYDIDATHTFPLPQATEGSGRPAG